MRVIKEAEERKNEILDAAESLFITKGYEHTSVNDILGMTGIAKGTFYYHFQSKEEVLDGIIRRRGDAGLRMAREIASSPQMGAAEKLFRILFLQKPENERQEQLIEVLEQAENARMFVKSLADIVTRLAPIVGEVLAQGAAEGVFATSYPKESAEILLAAVHALFDNPDFRWEPADMQKKAVAFLVAAERVCGAAQGAFLPMAQLF